ncbi:Pentatricopeptide repeat-containing protein [Ananas comosus]|uniref:Pentatricopeptide repeat-containing protein n=1 Tax=Ananas comosus TaxID=4615 RepID=A0A199VAD2_ANACO|nr:Pentatricopeptide repeat-containing protein [Ananas comosus]
MSDVLCGEIGLARDVFDKISQPSVFLWNALIRAYSWSGHFDKAIELYYQMVDLGVEPNKFTFPLVLQAFVSMLALEKGVDINNHARPLCVYRFDRHVVNIEHHISTL